ncbi:AMP-binding enzyme family protein [Mycobacterium xenopi 4042]|uniref:AMP-binding enzyme family protein n=1 Tax=Mycobacterium xenopi 4042 TaxID=1299334 RepID=X7ZUR0_MYCXE|nr:AMP-binding enzyme family protein [Mycobacterium xenopi 4042]
MIHGATQSATWMALFSGGTIVLAPEFDADEVWRTVHKHKVNLLFFTGDAMARPLLDALSKDNDYDLSSLYLLASTAALFSPSIKEKLLELLPNRVITDSIGSSETGFGGTSVVAKGQAHTGGPRVNIDKWTVVLDEDGNEVKPGSGCGGSSPSEATSRSATTRTRKSPRPPSRSSTACATRFPVTTRRSRKTAR